MHASIDWSDWVPQNMFYDSTMKNICGIFFCRFYVLKNKFAVLHVEVQYFQSTYKLHGFHHMRFYPLAKNTPLLNTLHPASSPSPSSPLHKVPVTSAVAHSISLLVCIHTDYEVWPLFHLPEVIPTFSFFPCTFKNSYRCLRQPQSTMTTSCLSSAVDF